MTVAIGPIESNKVGDVPSAFIVPDFIAGLIYGFTGDNHLDELRTCMTDLDRLALDINVVFWQLKEVRPIGALNGLRQLFGDLPKTVSQCRSMDEDLAEIEAWAAVFEDKEHLTKTITKHWLIHGKEVKADVAQEEADRAAGDYFKAGEDTAEILTILIGPVQPVEIQ